MSFGRDIFVFKCLHWSNLGLDGILFLQHHTCAYLFWLYFPKSVTGIFWILISLVNHKLLTRPPVIAFSVHSISEKNRSNNTFEWDGHPLLYPSAFIIMAMQTNTVHSICLFLVSADYKGFAKYWNFRYSGLFFLLLFSGKLVWLGALCSHIS